MDDNNYTPTGALFLYYKDFYTIVINIIRNRDY